jgi:hypothetical protein
VYARERVGDLISMDSLDWRLHFLDGSEDQLRGNNSGGKNGTISCGGKGGHFMEEK